MSTITQAQQDAIAAYVSTHHLPFGIGTEEAACSIAAINLALTNILTDTIPDCMSAVIGRWIIGVQDAMPDDMRNSPAWKSLLPLAAGTGRGHEPQRLAILFDWMWTAVLPTLQPIADKGGYGNAWSRMLTEKSAAAADAAARAAAYAADAAVAAYSAVAAYTAYTAKAETLKKCANIVRKHYKKVPKI